MRYEGQIYRPPGEWRSYLLQCTVGCSNNKCTFCGMYKTKKFHIRPMKEILEDIAMARAYYGAENIDKVFLCDGDAIVMRQEQLLQILEALYAAFPHLRQVTTYAGTRSTMTKTQEQLDELRRAGLTRAYLGVETGWDELLLKVKKGVTSAQMLEAAAMIKKAGIDLWVTVILGLAGPGEEAHPGDGPRPQPDEGEPRLLSLLHAGAELPHVSGREGGPVPAHHRPGIPGGEPCAGGGPKLRSVPLHEQPRLELRPAQGHPAGRPREVPRRHRQRPGRQEPHPQRVLAGAVKNICA